jgi:hypothetical protein
MKQNFQTKLLTEPELESHSKLWIIFLNLSICIRHLRSNPACHSTLTWTIVCNSVKAFDAEKQLNVDWNTSGQESSTLHCDLEKAYLCLSLEAMPILYNKWFVVYENFFF